MSGSEQRNEGEEAFVRQLKTMLDDGNARLDARVRSRLTQARYAALAQADARPNVWLRQWAPAAGIASTIPVPSASRTPSTAIPGPQLE